MPTFFSSSSSSIQLSSQLSRRKPAAGDNFVLIDMKPQKEEPKKVSNGSMAKREKVVRYRECRKNHAASIGGYAVDGCLEFMASGEEGTSAALQCAACNCHRSFHKREVDTGGDATCDCSSNSTSRRS